MGAIFEQAMRLEAEEILQYEIFVRSPMQSKLLKYLLARTVQSDQQPITQYDIATEGLGRSQSYDDTVESYARVQISRLKKGLAAYYSVRSPIADGCVYIKPGQYSLALGSLGVAYPEIAGRSSPIELPTTTARDGQDAETDNEVKKFNKRQAFGMGVVAAFALGTIAAFSPLIKPEQGAQASAPLRQPSIAASVHLVGFGSQLDDSDVLLAMARAEVSQRLARSVVLTHSNGDVDADYTLKVSLDGTPDGEYRAIFDLVDADGKQVFWNERAIADYLPAAREVIGWQVASIVSPPGIISQDLLNGISGEPRNNFECFLQSEVGRADGVSSNDLLTACSASTSDNEFYPFLKARELFLGFQMQMIETGKISQASPEWRQLGELLREYPENPYLNTIAAKALFAAGRCEDGEHHEKLAFAMGRDYPALDLATLIEKGSCSPNYGNGNEVGAHVLAIVESQTQPHALLETYALAMLLSANRPDLVDQVPERKFAYDHEQALVSLKIGLRAYANGDQGQPPEFLEALVWNDEVRRNIFAARTR